MEVLTIWEAENPPACEVEFCEQEAAHLVAFHLLCGGSKGDVVPWGGHMPPYLAVPGSGAQQLDTGRG